MEWMLMPYRRYAEFSGRSRRKEFWMFILLMVIVEIVLLCLMFAGGYSIFARLSAGTGPDGAAALGSAGFRPLFWIGTILLVAWGLASLIPYIAVTIRRLHDRNMSGWFLLGFMVVGIILSRLGTIGSVVMLALEIAWIVVLALPGTPGPNKYGPDPLGQVDAEVFA